MKSNSGQTSNFTSTSIPGIFLSTSIFHEKALGTSLASHVFWRWMSENNRFCSLESGSFYLALDALQSKTFYCGYSLNCHRKGQIGFNCRWSWLAVLQVWQLVHPALLKFVVFKEKLFFLSYILGQRSHFSVCFLGNRLFWLWFGCKKIQTGNHMSVIAMPKRKIMMKDFSWLIWWLRQQKYGHTEGPIVRIVVTIMIMIMTMIMRKVTTAMIK